MSTPRSAKVFRAYAFFGLLTLLPSQAALAASVEPAQRAEARERFDRGLTLSNQGDNQGALAEFQRAYQLTSNALVLYNIARVQAASGDPVAALDTLDKLVAEPGDLPAARRDQLSRMRQEQLQRVGSVLIHAGDAPGARVELDGAEVGALDPKTPLRLAAGRHVIGVLAAERHPLRKTVLVAGQEQKTLEFSLEPLEAALGRVRFKVEPIDVAVALDGQDLGKTPNLVEISLAPGRHRLALSRPGYRAVTREIAVPEAGTLEVTEKLAFDATNHQRGFLSVKASEEAAVVFVDGAVANEALRGVALPEGEHVLRVERAGFVTSERTIQVPRGSSAAIDVTLAPTPQYRADFVASTSSRRAWALGIGIGGAVLAGASGGYLIWNGGQVSDARTKYDRALGDAQSACPQDGGVTADCDKLRNVATIRESDLSRKQDHQVIGWVGLGLGAAGLATGAVLWLTGADPHRYDPRPESDVFGSLDVAPWFNGGGGGLLLRHAL